MEKNKGKNQRNDYAEFIYRNDFGCLTNLQGPVITKP